MPGNACGGSEEEAGQQCFRPTATALLDQLVQSFPESASALWSDMQSFTVPHDWGEAPHECLDCLGCAGGEHHDVVVLLLRESSNQQKAHEV